MWWQCNACGGHVERDRTPALCRTCGTAGVIFVPVGVDEPIAGDPEAGSPRAVWLTAALERARATLGA